MIAALVIIGQCVIVTPTATANQPEPQWQGRVAYRTEEGYGVARADRPSVTVVVPAERVGACTPKVASRK